MKKNRIWAFVFSVFFTVADAATIIPNNLFLPLTAHAEEYIWDDNEIVQYAIYEDHAEVIDCQEEYEGEIVIRAEISGVSVTTIDENAFKECSNIISVIVPDSVTSICDNAFNRCSNLTDITIPDSVVNLGDGVFAGCWKLSSVTMSNNIKNIGNDTFYACRNLTSFTVPDGVESIGNYAFAECNALTTIVIPNSITSIGDYAFSRCSSLISITLPDSVEEIGKAAFEECEVLETIIVPEKFMNSLFSLSRETAWRLKKPLYIVENVLKSCDNRAIEVAIPDNVTSIARYAFLGCSQLTSLTIPDSVISIDKDAFGGKSDLLTIHGATGSVAEQYALKNGYSFEATNKLPENPIDNQEPEKSSNSNDPNLIYIDVTGKSISIGDGIPTAVVFGRPTCLNTENTLKSISKSEWIKSGIIRVLYADIDGNNIETVSNFQSTLNTNDILFCSTENLGGVSYNTRMWNTVRAQESKSVSSVTCPVIAYYDGKGELLQYTTGFHTENAIYQVFMKSYVYLSEKAHRSVVSKQSVKEENVRTSTYNTNPGVTRHGNVDDLVELKDSTGNIYAIYQNGDTIYIICNNPEIDTVKIENPGFIFGSAALDDDDNLYVLWGYDVEWKREVEAIENKEENLQVIKYDLKGNKESSCPIPINLTEATNPFDYGNANMQCNRGVLGIFFNVQWAEKKSGDGFHHQGSEYASIDLASMKLLGVSNWEGSHSFGVRLIPTDYGFAGVQLGDADESRGINLNTYYADSDKYIHRKWYDGYLFKDNGDHNLFHSSGQYGTNSNKLDGNDTYLSIGGFAKSKSTYALAGKAEDYYTAQPYRKVADGITVRKDMYDVFVQIYDHSFSSQAEWLAGNDRINVDNGEIADRNIVWLAKADEHTGYGNVKIVTLKDGSYCVLWERINKDTYSFDSVRYVILNERGYVIRPESELVGARLSKTSIQPIVNGDSLTWAVADAKTQSIDFYSFDLSISQSEQSLVLGDVNGDKEISVEDAQLTLNAYVKIMAGMDSGLTDQQAKAANVNKDSEVSVDDAQTILLYYVRNTLSGTTTTWDELLGKATPASPRPPKLLTRFLRLDIA